MSEFDDLLRQELLRTRKAEDVDYGPAPVTGLADTFAAGVRSTTKQLGADVEYFKALSNTIIGDDEAAARNIERARVKEEFAAAPVETIETFGRFLEEPTVSGFFTQLAKGTGQVLPYAVTSIVGAGTGAIATAVGRGVLTSTSRAAAKKLIQESAERVAKNQATPDEKALVQGAYEVLQGQRKAIVRGGLGGAGASEYVPMAASNLSEALEVGEELDRSTAFRAAGLAIPQAVIGVGGEAFLAKSLFNVATKRAAKVKTLDAAGNPIEVPDKSTMVGRLASDLSKSALRAGATGSSTEVVQEGIAVANRFDLDDEYTVQDAQLRLAEAAFMGFFGEGVLGAAGGVAAGGVRELTGPNRFREISEEVLTKSRNLVEQGRDRTVGRIFEEEQYGDMSSGFTTPEPESDINAQLNALTNDSSSKKAVWIEGGVPQQGATKDGQIQRAIVNGYAAYTAFIPGKGTIVSLNKNLVEAVIRDGASDKSLQLALGYSAVKDTTAEDQLVVQALDKDGNIISAELTAVDLNDPRSTALNAAVAAAEKLAPEGGDVSVVTVADALEARKKKLGPSIAEMQWTAENEREAAAATGADIGGPSLEQEGELAQEALARLNEPRDEDTFIDYKARNPETDLYPNEWGAREAYENEFGVQDWDGEARFYSEGLIKRAVQLQEQNPDNDVFIGKTKEGKYRVISYNPDKDVELFDFKNEKGQTVEAKVSLKKFLQLAVAKATKGKFVKNSNVTLIPPEEGAKPFNVNLADLTFSGQRIIEQREGTFTGASAFGQRKKGFNAIINALLGAGYEIQFNGKSITEHTDAELRSINNVVGAVSETGSKIPVGRLLRGKKEDRAYDETFLESTASPIGGSPRPAITRDETDLDIEGGPVRDARSRTGWSISFEGASQIQQEKEREAGKTDEEAFGKEEFEMTPASAGETARVVYDPEKESPQLKVRPQGSEAQSDQTPYRGRTTATTGPELTEAGRAEAEAAATRRREADAARRTGPTKATGKPTPRPRETTEEFNERVRAKAEAVAAEEEFRTEAENERRSNEEAEAEFITEAENERRSNEEARAEAEEDFDDPADFYEDIYEGVEGEEPLGVLLERELEEAYEETQKLLSDNFGIDNPAVVGFIKALVSLANFKKPPYILSETLAREILENGEKNRYFLYEVLEDIKAGLARLDGPEGAVGVAVPVQIEEGRTVIILKSGLNNPLAETGVALHEVGHCLLYTSPSPRDRG